MGIEPPTPIDIVNGLGMEMGDNLMCKKIGRFTVEQKGE